MEPNYDAPHDAHHLTATVADIIEIVSVMREGDVAAAERMLLELSCDTCFVSALLRILTKSAPAEVIIDQAWAEIRDDLVENYG